MFSRQLATFCAVDRLRPRIAQRIEYEQRIDNAVCPVEVALAAARDKVCWFVVAAVFARYYVVKLRALYWHNGLAVRASKVVTMQDRAARRRRKRAS